MAQQELRNFGFGGTPRSKADKLFYQLLVLPAIRLEEIYAFYEFDHPRILSLMELIDWVTSTHQGTLKSRQSNKIKAAQKAREGKPIPRTAGKTVKQMKWDEVHSSLGFR